MQLKYKNEKGYTVILSPKQINFFNETNNPHIIIQFSKTEINNDTINNDIISYIITDLTKIDVDNSNLNSNSSFKCFVEALLKQYAKEQKIIPETISVDIDL